MRRFLVVLISTSLFIALGMGVATAGTNGPVASTDGSSAQFFHSGDKFKICDIDSDGDSVYVQFHYEGSGGDIRLNYTGGTNGGTNGSGCVMRTYNVGEGKTVFYKSCQNDAFNDTCSSEVTGIA